MTRIVLSVVAAVIFVSTAHAAEKSPTTRRSDPISQRLDRIESQLEQQRPAVLRTIEELNRQLQQLQAQAEKLDEFERGFGIFSDDLPHFAPLARRLSKPEPAPLLRVPRQREMI